MKHIKFDQEPMGLPVLGSLSRGLALESDLITGIGQAISGSLPRFLGQVSDFLSSALVSVGFAENNIKQSNIFINHLNRMGYANASALEIQVPESFHGKIAPYVNFLEDSTDHVAKLMNGVLVPYGDYLSVLLSSKDALRSSQEELRFLAKTENEREKLAARAKPFFRPGTVGTRMAMGEAVERLADWNGVFTGLQAIDKVYQGLDLNAVRVKVQDLALLIDAIKDAAKTDQLKSMNPRQLKTLAESTLQVAHEVEFLAVTRHRVMAFTTSIESTVEFVTELVS